MKWIHNYQSIRYVADFCSNIFQSDRTSSLWSEVMYCISYALALALIGFFCLFVQTFRWKIWKYFSNKRSLRRHLNWTLWVEIIIIRANEAVCAWSGFRVVATEQHFMQAFPRIHDMTPCNGLRFRLTTNLVNVIWWMFEYLCGNFACQIYRLENVRGQLKSTFGGDKCSFSLQFLCSKFIITFQLKGTF